MWALLGAIALFVAATACSSDDSESDGAGVGSDDDGSVEDDAPDDESVEKAGSTSAVLLGIYVVDSFGFHGMAEEYDEATEVGERDAGQVAKVIAAVDAVDWPGDLAVAAGALRDDLVATHEALDAGDLEASREALHAIHESQHGLSDEVYAWLPTDPIDSGGASGGEASGNAPVIEIAMDEFSFEPATIELEAGTPVIMRFTNVGVIEHEAMVGDAHMQEEFADQAAEDGDHHHGGHHGDVMAITLQPGETGDLEVFVEEPGEWFLGCHLPDHFDAGMVATLNVS